jgi:hypothetical protein
VRYVVWDTRKRSSVSIVRFVNLAISLKRIDHTLAFQWFGAKQDFGERRARVQYLDRASRKRGEAYDTALVEVKVSTSIHMQVRCFDTNAYKLLDRCDHDQHVMFINVIQL